MANYLRILFISLIISLSFSCTSLKITGRGAVPIMFNQANQDMVLIKHIKARRIKLFDSGKKYDITKVLRNDIEKYKPDAVTNTEVVVKINFFTSLLNLITLGIVQSSVVVVEADFMKKRNG